MKKVGFLLSQFTSHSLARSSIIVFAGTMLSNVGSYFYHLIMGRILGPVGYGELSSLISLLYIFGVPALVIQTVLVKYYSESKARNSPGEAKDLLLRTLKMISMILFVFGLVLTALSPLIAGFLHLESWKFVIWTYLTFVFIMLALINSSLFQGFQMFTWVSIFIALPILLKLLLSIPVARYGVEITLLASVLAGGIAYALSFFPVMSVLRSDRKRFDITKRSALTYSLPTFMAFLGITSLYSTDIMLAKHYLSAADAGIYSALSILGKIIFYASSAVIMVIFPIISERNITGKDSSSIIRFGLLIVSGISVILTAAYFILPGLVTRMLFGPEYSAVSSHLGMFAVFLAVFSIAYLLSMIQLALGRTRIWIITTASAILQIILITFFHSSISSIVYVNISVSLIMCLGLFAYSFGVRQAVDNGQTASPVG